MEINRPPFVPFDRERAVRVYRRNLPHWRQEGATYFVTFRLHDSMPTKAIERIKHEETTWLSARGITPANDLRQVIESLCQHDRQLYLQYFNRLRESIHDQGHGECWLKQTAVIDQLRTQIFQDDGSVLHIGDFILMPNHVHMLIVPTERELELCMKRIKGSSATLCNRLLGRSGTFWQADTFDHIVRNIEQLAKYRCYIRENPDMAGITVPPNAYYRADWM